MNEYTKIRGMNPLLKSFLIVLDFVIVAIPIVGSSMILRRESGPVTRFVGVVLLPGSIASLSYLVYYSVN